MSGDVQPRKRKDKRRRKDELSFEEPRGTAAVFGEGDVFMHSQHEHGTGGHWCAKVIFFSLLAILVTLIGLIILENRGLSELEANSVESRYSGVLEGWIEDAPDDDHHDEHTLELKHHDEDDGDDDEHGDITDEEHDVHDNEEDDEQADESDETEEKGEEMDEDDDDNSQNDEDDDNEEENETLEDEDVTDDRDQHDDDDDEDQALDSDEIEEDEDERNFRKYYENVDEEQHNEVDDEDDDDNKEDDDNDYHEDVNDDENGGDQNDDSNEDYGVNSAEDNDDSNQDEDNDYQQLDDDDNKEDDEESNEYEESHATHQNEEEGDEDETAEDEDIEVEKIEKEVSDEDVLEEVVKSSVEQKQEDKSAAHLEQSEEEEASEEDETIEEDEYLQPEDIEEPVVVERITAPAGKPLPEVEEGTSTEKPPDTLAEEEEYENQQEELRRQKDQASHLWLKVAVGGALLVATHAVIHRATAPRDPSLGEHTSREDTPSTIDRRMTLILEEPSIATDEPEEIPVIVKEAENVSTVIPKYVPLLSEKSEEEEEELESQNKNEETTEVENYDEVKELYSDDENEEEEELEVEVEKPDIKESVQETKEKIKKPEEHVKNVEPDEEVPEDVEIVDEELLEEEMIEEEEQDEDDISDVDDAELLSRLEAKYGRLPEPERPGLKKDGGNSLEDEWPGEPSEQYWRQQLDEAERELQQGRWSGAERRAGAAELRGSARARLVRARALDAAAEARRDNQLLSQAIAAYLELLKMNERLSDKKLLEIANRTLDRIRFRGNYLSAEPVYRLLIRRFPDEPSHRNNLSISFLMANRVDLAEEVLRETLRRWPNDRVALAHLGFVLKTSHNKLEEAVEAMRKALEGDIGAANEPRFYFHLGDALLLLGRFKEAEEVHKRGAALGHFLSPAQRSLYNVERLKSRPWWNIAETPYAGLARNLEASWQTILKEGEAARALYEQEKEGLKERGEWSQLDIFVRGQEIPGRCKKAPVTCSIVRQELAAVGCKRGQIKFSAMEAGTHVRPHVGPTNCRLRMHLGLSNTKNTFIRVDKEIRQWQAGKVLMFDDSFEHEVWHNGTGSRLVLIVDVWHPDLTPAERRSLPAI